MTTTPLDYALLAQEAYLQTPTIGGVNGAGRAITANTLDGKCLVFRGSDDLESWLHDFTIDTVEVNGMGSVHEGFWDAWLEIAVPCLTVQPNVVAGHSLGAALALIAAANLCLINKPPKAVYAFAPPKVSIDSTIGNLLKAYGVQLHLYRFKCDPVPTVPETLPFLSWQQPANVMQLASCTDPLDFDDDLADHAIKNYVNAFTAKTRSSIPIQNYP